jgi:hypothetical protein
MTAAQLETEYEGTNENNNDVVQRIIEALDVAETEVGELTIERDELKEEVVDLEVKNTLLERRVAELEAEKQAMETDHFATIAELEQS